MIATRRLVISISTALVTLVVANAASADEEMKESPRSVKLFDTSRSRYSWLLDIGPIWNRQVEDATPAQARQNVERGAPLASEIALGATLATPYKPVFLSGGQRTLLRILDDKSFSWSIFYQDIGGGLILGPIEPFAHVGVSVVTADVFHAEWSVQLLSPRVGAGIGIRIGGFRIDVKGHAEYLWRWFGPDYLVRGITVGIQWQMQRPRSPYGDEPR